MDKADGLEGPSAPLDHQARAGQLFDVRQPVESTSLPLEAAGVRLGDLDFPVLLMNLPLSLSTRIPNNAYMEDLSPSQREISLERAISQFMSLYEHVTRRALVY